MSHSYRGSHGTTFLHNPGQGGNVTIICDGEHVTVSIADLVEFSRVILQDTQGEAEAASH